MDSHFFHTLHSVLHVSQLSKIAYLLRDLCSKAILHHTEQGKVFSCLKARRRFHAFTLTIGLLESQKNVNVCQGFSMDSINQMVQNVPAAILFLFFKLVAFFQINPIWTSSVCRLHLPLFNY